MGFISEGEGIAASIFLALYVLYTVVVSYIVSQKGLKTVYSTLLFFGIIRIGAQLCGVAFSILGTEHWQWLVAYLVLGAEGYFSLIIALFYLYSHCLTEEFGYSFLDAQFSKLSIRFIKHPIRFAFHWILVAANALIISGGSMLTSVDISEYETEKSTVTTSRNLRCAGQAVFLFLTLMLICSMLYTVFVQKVRKFNIYLLLSTGPFLIIRGIFGILSSVIDKMNYYKLSNYDSHGLSTYFIATEYCLATTMEFISASILAALYFHEKDREGFKESESYSDIKEEA